MAEGETPLCDSNASPATCTFKDGSYTSFIASLMCTAGNTVTFGTEGVNGATGTPLTTNAQVEDATDFFHFTCDRGQLTAQLHDVSKALHETAYPDVVSVTCN